MARGRYEGDNDLRKHMVRLRCWLPAIEEMAQHVADEIERKVRLGERPLRYFSFPGAGALDIFFLHKRGLLSTSNEGRFCSVYYCERDASVYQKLSGLLGAEAEGFQGMLEEVVLFEDGSDTVGKLQPDPAEAPTADLLRKFAIKDRHRRFVDNAPYDVINLDLCGSLGKPLEPPFSHVLKSFFKLAEFQYGDGPSGYRTKRWLLLLTTRLETDPPASDYLDQIHSIITRNSQRWPAFCDAMEARFGSGVFHKSPPGGETYARLYAAGLPKVVAPELLRRGWSMAVGGGCIYERCPPDGPRYWMVSLPIVFERRRRAGSKSDEQIRDGAPYRQLAIACGQVDHRKIPHKLPSSQYRPVRTDLAQAKSVRQEYAATTE